MNKDLEVYLQPTPVINFNDPAVETFARENTGTSGDKTLKAVSLYYAVRDQIRYDPYKFEMTVNGLCAGTTVTDKRGWCVPKAILLAACCRFMGIPSRLGFADVKNHLSTERMRQNMKTDVFYWHGYTAIYLNGGWVKATPAFNIGLCEKFGLKPLEFDGKKDSIFHSFDLTGNRHMEYLKFRGEYADIPMAEMMETFATVYGGTDMMEQGDFDQDVDLETSGKGFPDLKELPK
jgi:transglutaminase-like putative cysteine protease